MKILKVIAYLIASVFATLAIATGFTMLINLTYEYLSGEKLSTDYFATIFSMICNLVCGLCVIIIAKRTVNIRVMFPKKIYMTLVLLIASMTVLEVSAVSLGYTAILGRHSYWLDKKETIGCLTALSTIVFGPFFEEIVVRGFIQPLLIKKIRPLPTILLCSLFFTAMHFPNYSWDSFWGELLWIDVGTLFFKFIFSVILCYYVYRTNDLFSVIIAHSVSNLIPVIYSAHRDIMTPQLLAPISLVCTIAFAVILWKKLKKMRLLENE